MIGLTTILYLVAGVCFIAGLKLLGRPNTARSGNRLSAVGMGAAVAGAMISVLDETRAPVGTTNLLWVAIGLVLGGGAGAVAARRVQMTSMPEMVALFNGFGGIASLLVGWSQLLQEYAAAGRPAGLAPTVPPFDMATIFLAVLIGGVTFTGSLVAFGKLSGKISQQPVLYPGQNIVNGIVLAVALVGGIVLVISPDLYWLFLALIVVSLFLGIAVVLPIGGADMPVVVALLNSYSGLAACAAGFAIGNLLLILTGALVGASGLVLTRIMCRAMNRSLSNVLFSGFGAATAASTAAAGEAGTTRSMTPEDAYFVLEAARSVVIIPGYGMAVSQAQHVVRELGQLLEANDAEVQYAIHPVAGRMPGHMNVLLAEADVPYEQLVEMEAINPVMDNVDVAIVIGANDVVNPAAREDKNSPIYGMPIIDADKARTVFVLKRSMASGFAGIENPLFFKDNTYMIFGDAKRTIEALTKEFQVPGD